uniref:Uncharacterized protein n=1 Tax=Ascaris lumbricoides TaxID=6252 RepID=A0A0M3IKE2_ASCLU
MHERLRFNFFLASRRDLFASWSWSMVKRRCSF